MVATRGRNKSVAGPAAKRPPKLALKGGPDGSPLAKKAVARLAAPRYRPSDGGKGWGVTKCICPKGGKTPRGGVVLVEQDLEFEGVIL